MIIGSGDCPPTEAILPADVGANVLGNVAFTFNPQLRDGLGDYEKVVSGSVLEPWQAFWVFQLPARFTVATALSLYTPDV